MKLSARMKRGSWPNKYSVLQYDKPTRRIEYSGRVSLGLIWLGLFTGLKHQRFDFLIKLR